MNYSSLLSSLTSDKWQRIGIQRRAGVVIPLFSIYSKNSVGIGEIPDLRFVIDWCKQASMSIIQLLPLNELNNDFAPYNALSSFALEPMYLSIKRLRKVDLKPFRNELKELKKKFPKENNKVDYEIKNEKMTLLKRIFDTINLQEIKKYNNYVEKNIHWLKYYSVYKVLSELNERKSWQEWDFKYKYIAPLTTEKLLQDYNNEINFYQWLQWQLCEQLTAIKKYAKRQNVFVMGDLPFLVSRDSADVWAYKNYFKLQLSSGAPPDMYFSKGQRWGMPPYNWDNIAADNYSYLKERLRYAENFYDMYRIDHFVGLFRIWTIDLKTPEVLGGSEGKFDPEEEYLWENHGRKILSVMVESTDMLPCAEDLGTVPNCSEKVLSEFGVPGINVQRWEKKRDGNYDFLDAKDYRINSVATVSTHDSSTLPAWWKNEAGGIDEIFFKGICEKFNIKDEDYNYIVNALFERKNLFNGRLFWKKEIFNIYLLLNLLNLSYENAKVFVDMYLTSYSEKNNFWNYIGMKSNLSDEISVNFIKKSLEKINSASSIFSIQLLMEYLYLDESILENYSGWNYRINFPGKIDSNNWSLIFPVSLEKLKELQINDVIREINSESNRL